MSDSAHPPINRQRLLDRFIRYTRIATPADPHSETYPSTACQFDLGRVLRDELSAMGAASVELDSHGLVWAMIPAVPDAIDGPSAAAQLPVVALVAHIDTSPEAPSDDISPQVIRSYPGGDIRLDSGHLITTTACPELAELVGKTLITTDGTTLLGGDDKAGVAILMELAETLMENPTLARLPLRILFTCDEEIGKGTDKIDLKKLGATVAYTVDGGGAGVIDVETFSADSATVVFTGFNIHPAIAKGRMVNAVRVAADFIETLPRESCAPEVTEERDGFIHPHTIRGGVGEASVELILRSFESADLSVFAKQLGTWAGAATDRFPGSSYQIRIDRQYRNLRDGLAEMPEAVSLAVEAFENLGRPCREAIVRGGTDGSVLTEKGLPTPNLSSGQHNIHSVGEFACLEEMIEAIEHLVELTRLWSTRTS